MYCRGLFVVATLLLSSLGVSQESAALSPSDKQSIDALLTDYVQAFMAKDYVKLRDCLQAPFVRLSAAGEPNVVSTLDEVITLYHTLRDGLISQGAAFAGKSY
jgi:hypothetical protein